ncbi:alkaline phosphatase family protein [Streptomyces sp. CB01881]|uniref:alkaline phosphatase family protein n=1 Tax=Streptomyces sp. CB01881 TaxID=2078691 RepID=UPI000CDC86F1|nr:alkaline phosphatase family protein [Streptomyces sp. CB01881]AUY48270.1 hypothetical protein C2142_04050 [Streptomyces sp. CB01881]TYC76760.1 hypothetical protein EH183_04060 [Streptomyces sp. CB01881]
MAAEAARVPGSGEDLDASFVHLGAVDETAHFLGCGPEYRRATETADGLLGQLLTAVRGRPGARTEEWTVIAVTDHGHREGPGRPRHPDGPPRRRRRRSRRTRPVTPRAPVGRPTSG